MSPLHRYNRVSRPSSPPYADTSVDRAVARCIYNEDPFEFAREVDTEYRKLCEELIERVGNRFVSAEVQRMQHRLVANDSDASSLTPSAVVSGGFGRPSLDRLSVGSTVSVGQYSMTGNSPLRIIPELHKL
ncbi:unnamed protein product [Strongylus vulgaris]|uniref:Uncharacterized protein n=1 Tax=Strongylus vulgaris TaxID=40348 RepID=A0A3P7JX12_STRVU|nr:unnamed protein product [Strongylus vulgaris]